jgi:hypothetical protein
VFLRPPLQLVLLQAPRLVVKMDVLLQAGVQAWISPQRLEEQLWYMVQVLEPLRALSQEHRDTETSGQCCFQDWQ